MAQSREQVLRNLAKARAVRKRNLAMMRNPDGDVPVAEVKKRKRRTVKQAVAGYSEMLKKSKTLTSKQEQLLNEALGVKTQKQVKSFDKMITSRLGTKGSLTAAIKKAIAAQKKLKAARAARLRTRRPAPTGEAKPMTSYTVRFYTSSGPESTPQNVGNTLSYFTIRAAATDAKSIVRAAVGRGVPIYEGGYEGAIADSGNNKAFDTAAALLSIGSSKQIASSEATLPLSEAPVEVQEVAPVDNYEEFYKSNPRKVYTAVKRRVDEDGKVISRKVGYGAPWENVLQTDGTEKMFMHPKLYVAQMSGGYVLMAVISEDMNSKRGAQVESLANAASTGLISPAPEEVVVPARRRPEEVVVPARRRVAPAVTTTKKSGGKKKNS